MSEIKRYNLEVISMHDAYGFMEESDDGGYVEYSEVEQLQARIKELESKLEKDFQMHKKVFEELQYNEKLRWDCERILNSIIEFADEQVINEMVAIPVSILSDINLYYEGDNDKTK